MDTAGLHMKVGTERRKKSSMELLVITPMELVSMLCLLRNIDKLVMAELKFLSAEILMSINRNSDFYFC